MHTGRPSGTRLARCRSRLCGSNFIFIILYYKPGFDVIKFIINVQVLGIVVFLKGFLVENDNVIFSSVKQETLGQNFMGMVVTQFWTQKSGVKVKHVLATVQVKSSTLPKPFKSLSLKSPLAHI